MQQGIWRYAYLYPPIDSRFRLTLNEGDTPMVEIEKIFFKREDENPTGSIKDRGVAYQISNAYQLGQKNLVISSSGNAAISAAAYCCLGKMSLTAFVSPKIDKEKLEMLQKFRAQVTLSRKPISEAVKLAKQKNFRNLRPSTDKLAVEGFKSIAFEIYEDLGEIEAIFLPVSSGTSLAGVAYGFEILGLLPKIFAVQTTAVHPIAGVFDQDFTPTRTNLATALVARYTPKRREVISLIKKSGGSGLVVSDEDIKKALRWLSGRGIDSGAEGGAALAGLFKAKKKGLSFKKPVCLLTGALFPRNDII
jgi:threonine synthase